MEKDKSVVVKAVFLSYCPKNMKNRDRVFYPKLFSVFASPLDSQQLAKDILAGVVVGIVALPLAIAFAIASGVSPERGIVTAIVAGFIISFLGGSRVQIGGPTGAFIVIVFGIIEQYGYEGLVVSTILAGLILIVFGLLRLGQVLKYFPHSLIVGFTTAIAVIIFSGQMKDVLGLSVDSLPAGFVGQWRVYVSQLQNVSYASLAVAAATVGVTVFANKKVRLIPGSLVSIISVTAAVLIFDVDVPTIETFFGDIPNTFHLSWPVFHWNQLYVYIAPAFTIALLGSIESLLSATVADGMIGGHHRANTELIAQGIANIVTPFFGGIPATGAIARTATNVKNGGRTPVAGIVHAVVLLCIMFFFGRWVKLIPMSCLAGILIVVAYNMSEWRSFLQILRGSSFDRIILLSTFCITLFFNLTLAIQIGVVLSALLFMKRMADISEKKIPHEIDRDVIENYSDFPPEISIYEISGPLFFASARSYCEAILETGFKSTILIIRMRHVPFVDQTGLNNLKDVLRIFRKRGTVVVLSGVNDEIKQSFVDNQLTEFVGEPFIFCKFEAAVQKAYALLEGKE